MAFIMSSLPEITIKDLTLDSFDDVIYVCSIGKIMKSEYVKGAKLKREWFKEHIDMFPELCKIAYLGNEPVAQITLYPHSLDPLYRGLNGKAIIIHCIYCPFKKAQRKGIAKKLVEKVKKYAKEHGYDFVIANAFDTGEFLPMPKFYEKIGFTKMMDLEDHYYVSLTSKEPKLPPCSYEEDPEDREKAIIFYSRVCHVFYPLSLIIKKAISDLLPNYSIVMIDYWKNPELFLKKGKNWLIVNDVPIKAWFQEKEKFRQEVLEASRRAQHKE